MSDEPTNMAPDGQDTPTGDGGGENWIESFVPEEYRESGFVSKYNSREDFFNGMANQSKLVGQKPQGLVAPGEGASDEEVAAFHASLREISGVPASLKDYQSAMELPELGEGALMPKFVEMAHREGVPPQAMQNLISGLNELVAADNEAAEKAYGEKATEEMEILRGEWDKEFDYKFNVAERFASEFSDETLQMLKDAKWGDKATIVRDLARFGEQYLTEGDLADISKVPGGGAGVPTMEGLVAMKGDPRYADPDLRDENYVKEVHEYAVRLTEHLGPQGRQAEPINMPK